MTKLAQKYGMSDVTLRKKCRELMIPLPPAGYWQKKQYGKAPARSPLPPLEEAEEIRIGANKKEPLLDKKQLSDAARRIAFEKLPENHICVSSALKSPHPLVGKALRLLGKAKPVFSIFGILRPGREACLDIRVT